MSTIPRVPKLSINNGFLVVFQPIGTPFSLLNQQTQFCIVLTVIGGCLTVGKSDNHVTKNGVL